MLNIERLLEPIASKALINKVYKYSLYERMYLLPVKNPINIKHVIENYIMVEKVIFTKQGHPYSYTQVESSPYH